MVCGICGGSVKGTVRFDPEHAGCVRKAESRMNGNMCGRCGENPIEHDGQCKTCLSRL